MITTVIIEGATILYNFLVDYRDEHSDKEEGVNESKIFTDDINSSEECAMVVGNDVCVSDNISNHED